MEDAQEQEQAQAQAKRWVRRLIRKGQLPDLREDAGLTQSDVARAVGVTPSTVSRWEAGRMSITGEHAVALLALLGD